MHPSAGPLPFAVSRSEVPGCAAGTVSQAAKELGVPQSLTSLGHVLLGSMSPILENDL